MKYLLSKASLPIVERLARDRTLCAFDFDGTLAPIVDHPRHARMRGPTRRLLQRVASLYPCIVVSGRRREDVLAKLRGIPLAGVFGNHGAEADGMGQQDPRVKHWKAVLQDGLGPLPGVWVEDKGASLAVHYRQSIRPIQSRRKIAAAISKLNEVRAFGGKKVVNLVADSSRTKGDAVAAERDRLRCDWVLYVGDDQNDEDAFALQGNLVAVRIGRKKHTRANYYLRSQMEIDQLLVWMARLRKVKSAE
jgi:trehalose 6-phosphate phosphatase